MASLANQTISSTYDGLVKTSTDQPVPISGVQLLEDGVGNSLALSVGRANQGVTITGTATATAFAGPLTGNVTGDLTGSVLTAAQTNITSVGTLSSLAVSGNLAVDTNTLFVDAANNKVVAENSSAGNATNALVVRNSGSAVVNTESRLYLSTVAGDNRGCYIASKILNTNNENALILATNSVGADATERMRIDSSGNVSVGTASARGAFRIYKDSDGADQFLSLENSKYSGAVSSGETKLMFGWADHIAAGISAFKQAANKTGFKIYTENGYNVPLNTVTFPFNGGIAFNGDTSSANALDDYEEGTFTVTNNGDATGVLDPAATSGQYTKIGKVVYFRIVARASSNFTGAAIGGLPFTVGGSSLSTLFGVFDVLNTSESDLTAIPRRNETALQFYQSNLVASGIPLTTTINTIRVAGWYFVD